VHVPQATQQSVQLHAKHRSELMLDRGVLDLLGARRRGLAPAAAQGAQGQAREAPRQSAGRGAAIFAHACKLGAEGIVSKHREHLYRSGPSKAWLKTKNPAAPGMLRFREEP
jgi:hypothetical protein